MSDKTCAERVQANCDSALNDIRITLDPQLSDYVLVDDGTLDTVISVGEEQHRFNSDSFDDESPKTEQAHEMFGDEIRDTMREQFTEYALDFSYVSEGTFNKSVGAAHLARSVSIATIRANPIALSIGSWIGSTVHLWT